jgi:hypothetical protein
MGMFNEFLNNDNNTNVNKKMLVNMTRFLTNNERIELKRDLNNGKNINRKMNAIVKRKLNGANMKALKISPLKLGFFNAIVNDKFDKKDRIDLVNIFEKKPHAKKSIPRSSLDIEIKSIKLYHGQFKVGAEHSLSGIFGEVDPKKKYFMAQITAQVYDGKESQKINFRVYRNGKIHFSGGILKNNIKQPEQIRKYMVDTFTAREKFLYSPIVYNNTAGQFDVNGALNLSGVVRAFRISTKIDYEPELRAALRMNYLGSSFQLFTTGIVQILGARSEMEMLQAYEYGKDLVTQLYVMGLLTISNAPTKKAKAKAKPRNVAVNASDTVKNVYEKLQAGGKANSVTVKSLCEGLKKKKPITNNSVTYNNKKNTVKIGKRACTRYPKAELMAAAKRIGVVDIKATTSKEKICEKIKKHVFGNFNVNNKPCLGYTKAQLMPLAVAKGISVTDNDTVKTICEKMQKPPSPVKKKKTVVKDTTLLTKRRLTNNTIKKNLEVLYGKKWMNTYKNVMPSLNKNVEEIKKRIEALDVKRNKGGVPFKKNVNALKKMSVRDWKLSRKKNLNNKLNALNNNFANELENLMNVEIVKKKKPTKTKFLKGTKVEEL